jgi:hypothetical protein
MEKIENPIFKTMNTVKYRLIVSLSLLFAYSCNEPETVVTNIVHPDGSVTRKIEMRSQENKFELSAIQVPLDTSWTIRDSMEINAKGDTLWVRRAEKLFVNTEELSGSYLSDSSANRESSRHASFIKKFRWFSTGYRFSEIIDSKIPHGYPVSDFLNQDELQWFFSPDNLKEEKKNSADSLKYRSFNDTVEKKLEHWIFKCLASEWIHEFTGLIEGRAGVSLNVEALKAREDEFVKVLEVNIGKADSLWSDGTLLKQFIGEADAMRFKSEADSAVNIAAEKIWFNFNEYTVRTIMPGRVTGTGGFIDSAGVISWPVKSDFFLAQQYEMWAESKSQNRWAWIVTGIFVLFVFSGILLGRKRKG